VRLRITGLVKIFNEVRAELVAGIPPNRQAAFRRKVENVIGQVEQICRQHRKTPDALPVPSRNAYYFLKNLDLMNLPTPNHPQQAMTGAAPLRINGLISTAQAVSEKLWQNASAYLSHPRQFAQMRDEIQKKYRRFAARLAKAAAAPSQLPQPSRNAYCWLGFLAIENNLRKHLTTINNIQIVLSHHFGEEYLKLVDVQFVYTNYIYRFQKVKNKVVLRCNEALIEAGHSVWLEIFQRTFAGQKSQRHLDAYLHSGRYQQISREMDAFARGDAQTRGQYFDLHEVFQRVNDRYFNGELSCPQLHWNQTLTNGKLGHYHVLRDELMISVTLDHAEVPAYVMGYVMYHELLHKKHGVRRKNGRVIGHFKAFRDEEKRFPKYREANEFIKTFLGRQRRKTKQNNGALFNWIKRKYSG
jgi:hypothetical protein